MQIKPNPTQTKNSSFCSATERQKEIGKRIKILLSLLYFTQETPGDIKKHYHFTTSM